MNLRLVSLLVSSFFIFGSVFLCVFLITQSSSVSQNFWTLPGLWNWLGSIFLAVGVAVLISLGVYSWILRFRTTVSRRFRIILAGVSGIPSVLIAIIAVQISISSGYAQTPRSVTVLLTILLIPRALQLLDLATPRSMRRWREATLSLGGTSSQFVNIWLLNGNGVGLLRIALKLFVIGLAEVSVILVFLTLTHKIEESPFSYILNGDPHQIAAAIIPICFIVQVLQSAFSRQEGVMR